MLSNSITSDNIKFICVDDDNLSFTKGESFSQDNCFVEVRIKKSFLSKFLDCASSILNDKNVSDISMTDREIEVLTYLAEGLNNQQIAKLMNISIHTIKAHIHNIFAKLCVQGRTEAVVKAIKDNLIKL